MTNFQCLDFPPIAPVPLQCSSPPRLCASLSPAPFFPLASDVDSWNQMLMPARTIAALLLLAAARLAAEGTNFTVDAAGGTPFKTVQEAINLAPSGTAANPTLIHIKPGAYRELIYVQREKRFIRLVGEDPAKTILTYDLYAGMTNRDGKPIGTFRTPSTTVDADDFSAEGLTFENAAGPKGQALAIRLDGDRDAFRRCRFLGWQDTILDNRGRHYFADCEIVGSVDFIFGGATSWFENCRIHCRRDGYITAASTPSNQAFGFVFTNCVITGETPETRTYLGRPWRPYASVTFLGTTMSEVVRPVGWNNWKDPAKEKTARYAEFASTGPGTAPDARCSWATKLSPQQAAAFTLDNVLGGEDHWKPW
jgi:pectinesterase